MNQYVDNINKIIESQYNGYRGRVYSKFKRLHQSIREKEGDEKFLAFLEQQLKENPKPIYTPSITI